MAEADHVREVDEWHAKRESNLKSEHGWLSLVALDWLNEGENKVEAFGVVTLNKDNSLNFKANSDVQVLLGGNPFTEGRIRSDAEENGPDKLFQGTKAFVVIKRGTRHGIRMWDSQAETRIHFTTIERFPVSSKWRIEGHWQPYDTPKHILLPSVVEGYEEESIVPGVVSFTVDGQTYKLEPVLEDDTDDLFFIFGDKTNGSQSYPGGRFFYASRPSAAEPNKMILDFNKAYTPPCCFTPHATCPLPSLGNKLKLAIEAGEKKYGDH